MAGLDATGRGCWVSGGGGGVGEESRGAVTCSSPRGVSWGNVGGGGGGGSADAAPVSGCGISVFVARAAVPAVFRALTTGDAPPPARAAAAAAAA